MNSTPIPNVPFAVNFRLSGRVTSSDCAPAFVSSVTESRVIGVSIGRAFNVKHNGKTFKVGSSSSSRTYRFVDAGLRMN